jgi:predicted metal-binding membrane protein
MDVGMDMWIMPQMMHWDATDLGLVLLMWGVMMVAMMLPSVLPVILVLIRFDGSAPTHTGSRAPFGWVHLVVSNSRRPVGAG